MKLLLTQLCTANIHAVLAQSDRFLTFRDNGGAADAAPCRFLDSRRWGRLATLVAELIRRLLPTGPCTVDTIADQLAMYSRSLQRRLAIEGTRCQDLIERERRAQAARYLAEPGLHLRQIAGLLG